MSPPAGRAGRARVMTCPAGSTAYTRPLVSSAAIRSPPNRPKVAGATVIPPSTAGAPAAMIDTRPSQPMPNTVVRPPRPALRADHHDARPGARLQGEGRAVPERAPGSPDRIAAGQREVRLGTHR